MLPTQPTWNGRWGLCSRGWPPIMGVIHAAGIMENRFMLDMDAATFGRVIRPKLEGAQNLDRLLPDVSLFIVFSSIIAYVRPHPA